MSHSGLPTPPYFQTSMMRGDLRRLVLAVPGIPITGWTMCDVQIYTDTDIDVDSCHRQVTASKSLTPKHLHARCTVRRRSITTNDDRVRVIIDEPHQIVYIPASDLNSRSPFPFPL